MSEVRYVVWRSCPFETDDIDLVLRCAEAGHRIFKEVFFERCRLGGADERE